MLKKLQPPTGRAARFADTAMQVGLVDLGDWQAHCLFNWGETDERRQITLPRSQQVRDFWTDEDLGRLGGRDSHLHVASAFRPRPHRNVGSNTDTKSSHEGTKNTKD